MNKKATKPPVLKREKRWKLKGLTCAQLAELVSQPSGFGREQENPSNDALRGRYAHPANLERLKLCGSLSAQHHAAHTRTAARLQRVPTLVLTATGGRPSAASMPRYDASLKRMGEQHGLVIHRMDDGAFIMCPNPPKSPPAIAKLSDQSFELDQD